MFAPTEYLRWARRFYGKVRFDLATSGMPTVSLAELGLPPVEELDDPEAHDRLRAAIAKYSGVPGSEAVAALGTTHALWLAYSALVSPGDEVLVEDPAYEPLVRIAEGVGARVTRFVRHPAAKFAIDPERIRRAMTPRTRVVAVTNLHNPSGVRAGDDELRGAAEAAAELGAHLVVDEVYAPFDALVDERGVFEGSARRLAPNVVAVSSLTKCYGLGPERIGWMLGPAAIVARADDAVTAACGIMPLLHAHVALRAFERISALAERARLHLPGKRQRVAAWTESRGLAWSDPRDGLFGLVTIPGAGDVTALVEWMASTQEVLVAPGSFFGVPGAFRLAWASQSDELDEALARLEEGLARGAGLLGRSSPSR